MNLAKLVFETHLRMMKKMLRLGEFKFGSDSETYKYYKEEVMKYSYETIQDITKRLLEEGLIEKCPCEAKGTCWTNCPDCAGAGYKTAT